MATSFKIKDIKIGIIMKMKITTPLFLILLLCGCSQVKQLTHNHNDEEHHHDDKGQEVKKVNELAKSGPIVEENIQSELDVGLEELAESEGEKKKARFTLEEKKALLKKYCDKTDKSFKKYGWGESKCSEYSWNFFRTSVKGDPLLWKTYGTPAKAGDETETTLIMCGVHGDEITPIKFCYDVITYLERVNRGEVQDEHTGKLATLEGKRVIVAPLVNPDSYFKKRPTRTNANGVDVNRNFPTRDFKKSAMKTWVNRYRKDKRRFPGKVAMSEPETIFQVNLIYRYQPHKIISVHAPLSMLDYDGPANAHEGGFVGSRANDLLIRMSEQAKGYRIKNYPFFTGSLGNYAGNERNIPTFTLELPTSNPAKSDAYWHLFKDSIHSAVMHEIQGEGFVALDREGTSDEGSRSN